MAEAQQPDAEMRLYMAITRRLPHIYGLGAAANVLKRIYTRKPRPIVQLEAHGLTMQLDPNEFLDREIIFTPQLYDRAMLDHLRRLLKPGDTFLDAGANIGVFTLIASRLVGPQGRILSIDADPRVFQILQHNIQLNHAKNITPVNAGLSDAPGTLRFSYGAQGMRGVGTFLADGQGDLDVAVHPLSKIAHEHGFPHFTGIKIDIEGFEHRVLTRYLDDTPPDHWPRFILVERLPHLVQRAGGDVITMLHARGYQTGWADGADHLMTR